MYALQAVACEFQAVIVCLPARNTAVCGMQFSFFASFIAKLLCKAAARIFASSEFQSLSGSDTEQLVGKSYGLPSLEACSNFLMKPTMRHSAILGYPIASVPHCGLLNR